MSGIPHARQPMVLVPGLTCDGQVWRAQMADLADMADMRVADTLSDDSIAAMAQRLLDEAPPSFALAGFSMGGYVAMEVMRRASHRVSRLALLDTSARIDDAGHAAVRRAAVRTARERGFEKVLRGSLSLLVHPDADPAIGEEVVAMALRVGIDAFERQQGAIIGRSAGLLNVVPISGPVLVLVGAQDRTTPLPHAEELARAMPSSRLVIVPESGHMTTMEQPAAVNAALRAWLAQG